MPKPDALDVVISTVLLILTLVVAPALIGRTITPYLDGEPRLLNATILAERRYITQARATLTLCAGVEAYLWDLPPAEQAFDASVQLQERVDATDRAWSMWDGTQPPGRFSALHGRMLALVKVYRYLAGEAWAYYGDLDDAHLADVRGGLAEASGERERLEELLQALDLQSSPAHPLGASLREGPQLSGSKLHEWE